MLLFVAENKGNTWFLECGLAKLTDVIHKCIILKFVSNKQDLDGINLKQNSGLSCT
jgi:hypothetical protein